MTDWRDRSIVASTLMMNLARASDTKKFAARAPALALPARRFGVTTSRMPRSVLTPSPNWPFIVSTLSCPSPGPLPFGETQCPPLIVMASYAR